MPTLAQVLPTNDIGYLRIVASLWGLELISSDPAEAAVELGESLCDAELLEEITASLPKEGQAALLALVAENGRMPWVVFTRRFGELREMGAAKRDREMPYLNPSSATEILWYRALIARAFFDGEKGMMEFAFIPDDIFMTMDFGDILADQSKSIPAGDGDVEEDTRSLLNPASDEPGNTLSSNFKGSSAAGRAASPAEKSFVMPASDHILDDACSYLAALRMELASPETSMPAPILHELLRTAGLIAPDGLNPQKVKSFLEAPRDKALELLLEKWQSSETFNELRQLPGLVCEGGWSNQPLVTREFLLEQLEPIPEDQWWSLPAFVRDIKAKNPDFQRPAGDYDTWFIKRKSDGVYLRGFSNWDEVDGALIRYLICGPLHWLGLLDLASTVEAAPATAFRLRNRQAAAGLIEENGKLTVSSEGKIVVQRAFPRAIRYQIARFTDWNGQKNQEYTYHVSAPSLKRAKAQGLKVEHLLTLLQKYSASPLPAMFVKALQRWEKNGTEARINKLVVLKVARPEVLNELRASKANRFLGEILGPTTIVIQAGAQAKVLSALAEMGLLAEEEIIV